jgi:hypothetical protein
MLAHLLPSEYSRAIPRNVCATRNQAGFGQLPARRTPAGAAPPKYSSLLKCRRKLRRLCRDVCKNCLILVTVMLQRRWEHGRCTCRVAQAFSRPQACLTRMDVDVEWWVFPAGKREFFNNLFG